MAGIGSVFRAGLSKWRLIVWAEARNIVRAGCEIGEELRVKVDASVIGMTG